MLVWVFPAIHDPDGLFLRICSANLTFHCGFSSDCCNEHEMQSKKKPDPMVRDQACRSVTCPQTAAIAGEFQRLALFSKLHCRPNVGKASRQDQL
jgi:hypothetical protein